MLWYTSKMNNVRDPIAHVELHNNTHNSRLNWLRASVLGANDGIVSISAVIVGVAGADVPKSFILIAGVASLVAGALSMAVGEYVSVSTQKDTEKALLEKEKLELITVPDEELEELISIYQKKGLSLETAKIVAKELTLHDAFAAHVDAELGINPNDLANPFHAAYASGLAFLAGAMIPIIAIIVSPPSLYVPMTFIAVVVALIITGSLSAHAGGASKAKATIRIVLGGVLAMIVTFGIGKLFGIAGI